MIVISKTFKNQNLGQNLDIRILMKIRNAARRAELRIFIKI